MYKLVQFFLPGDFEMAHAIHRTNNPSYDYIIYSDPRLLQEDLNQDPNGTVERVHQLIKEIPSIDSSSAAKFRDSLQAVKLPLPNQVVNLPLPNEIKWTKNLLEIKLQLIRIHFFTRCKDFRSPDEQPDKQFVEELIGNDLNQRLKDICEAICQKEVLPDPEVCKLLFPWACCQGLHQFVKKILELTPVEERGALVNAQEESKTPLMEVFNELNFLQSNQGECSDKEFIKKEELQLDLKKIAILLLEEKSIDLSIRSKDDGDRALEYAILTNQTHFVGKILAAIPKSERAKFIDEEARDGSRAIYLACKEEYYDMVPWLMSFSPTLFFAVETGETVLDYLKKAPSSLKKIIRQQFLQEMSQSESIPEKMELAPIMDYIEEKNPAISEEVFRGLAKLSKGAHSDASALGKALGQWLRRHPKASSFGKFFEVGSELKRQKIQLGNGV